MDGGPFLWRPWRGDNAPSVDLDGKPLQAARDLASSSESLKLARHADERSSGKSTRSAGSGYLTMSCLKHEPSEDSDASAERPARPPKPARLSPSRATAQSPLCEYVDVEPRPPERRAKPDTSPRRPDTEPASRCREYELMANFMSHARHREDDTPPAVPPRARALPPRSPPEPAARSPSPPLAEAAPEAPPRPRSNIDNLSNDDSLLDELQREYCVLKVCEDDPPKPSDDPSPALVKPSDSPEKEECGTFSRVSVQRKSNPIKTQTRSMKPLKTSSSTSNVADAGSSTSRPLAERLTPFFLKKKPKPPEDAPTSKSARKEDNLIGRLTPRFGQSRLYGREQSLDLTQPESRTRRIERSATTVNFTRPMNSSIVAHLKFLSLHRYGAQEEVQCRACVSTNEEDATQPTISHDNKVTSTESTDTTDGAENGALDYVVGGDSLDAVSWRHPHAPSLLAATNDIRL